MHHLARGVGIKRNPMKRQMLVEELDRVSMMYPKIPFDIVIMKQMARRK